MGCPPESSTLRIAAVERDDDVCAESGRKRGDRPIASAQRDVRVGLDQLGDAASFIRCGHLDLESGKTSDERRLGPAAPQGRWTSRRWTIEATHGASGQPSR